MKNVGEGVGEELDIFVDPESEGPRAAMCRLCNGLDPKRNWGSWGGGMHISLGYITSVCIAFALVCPYMINLDEMPTWDIDLRQLEKYNIQHNYVTYNIPKSQIL